MWFLDRCQQISWGTWGAPEPPEKWWDPWWDIWLGFRVALTDGGLALYLQGAGPALLTPRTRLPAQDRLLQGESLLLNFFFPKRILVPISMDSLAGKAAAGWGGVEQLKFSKEGEPQLVLTLRKGDSLLG